MDIKIRFKAIFLSFLAFGLIIFTIFGLGIADFNNPYDFDLVQLDTGWTICRDGEQHPIENLSNANIDLANKGDIITLSTVLPTDININQACLEFRSILSTVDVYLDGKLIYSIGHNYVSEGKMVPKFHNFIPLPDDFEGKNLEITFTAQEDNAFSGFSDILLGHYKDIANKLLQPNRLAIIIGVFLCILGFILLVISPILFFSEYHDFSIFFSANISLFMGAYILCFNNIFWYLSNQPALYTLLEYLSLYLVPPSIIGFILTTGQIYHKKSTNIIFVIDISFVVITLILHITNIAHICHFITIYHFLFMSEGIFILASLLLVIYEEIKTRGKESATTMSTTMLVIGLIFFLFCALIDIAKFNLFKYGTTGEMNVKINFTTVGSLIFMICLFLNYFFHRIEYISASATTAHLQGLAYTDSLTGLANRAKCELSMAELSGNYTIISLDMDYLKYTNDTYGHSEGDKLLTGFSEILNNSFTDATLIGRMGGDEYIVILPFVDEQRTQRSIDCMVDLMCYRTSKEDHLRYSASWGYASSNEPNAKDISAQGVYLIADTRMYEMKKNHHNQTLDRLYDDLLNHKATQGGSADEKQ